MRIVTTLDDPSFFLPNPGAQRDFMDDYTHRYCALAGGWFAGKTWAGARKLVDLHLHNAHDDHGRPTGVRSEERRVGKECRARGSQSDVKKSAAADQSMLQRRAMGYADTVVSPHHRL